MNESGANEKAISIWCVQGHASVIAQLSHPDLYELQLLH